MMKTKQIYLFLTLALLCACSSDEELSTVAQQPCNALELTVSAGGFVTDSDVPGTRASDNGAATTFENNDRVGVIILENGTLKGNNLPYKYNGSSWSFDAATASGEGSGKNVYYYDNKGTNITYIIYFPYSTDANGVISLDGDGGLKSKFIPKADQQLEADYRASDLMIWQSAAGIAPQKELAATLTHAYNSISLLPEVHYTLGNEEDFVHPSPAISDVNFIMEDKIVYPYKAADGSYRCILPSGLMNNSVRCFYTVDNRTYSKDLTVSLAGANTRYSSTPNVSAGTYSLANAQVGDFYCKNASNEGYLIPGDIASLTEDQQKDCVGVVYWVGDDAFKEDPLLKANHSDCTHGLVVALQDVSSNKTPWSSEYEDITNEWLGKLTSSTYVITTLKETDKMQGYANTKVLDGYNQSDRVKDTPKREVLPIDLIQTYAGSHPAPTNSSNWYFPSIKELKYMCWGQNAGSGTGGKGMLDKQFRKVSGSSSLQSDRYWSSAEDFYNWAWYVNFLDGNVNGDYIGGKNYSYWLRAVLAF